MVTMHTVIDQLFRLIEGEMAEHDPLIVAIDGRCASGKTTIATELARRLKAELIHMDDFFLRPEQRTQERLSTPGGNIDHERFLEEVLIPLCRGEVVSYRPFSCATQALGEPISVPAASVILVEGSYACHPCLRDHYGLRIFLTVNPEEQMHRLRLRNGAYAEVFRDRWIPLEESYFGACDVQNCCHVVMDTSGAEACAED